MPIIVQAGSLAATKLLANVSDDQTAVTALTAQINGAASATVNGVTVSGLTINASAQLQGQVAPACGATTPAVFMLNVIDGAGVTTNATLTLNMTTGVLSGTPTVNGTFTFRIAARGFGNCMGFRDYILTINAAPCPTVTLPASLPNGTRNALYMQSVAAAPSGSYSYQVTGGSLPPGITFYGPIGLFFGYPTTISDD
jgi:hypothetical protein